MCVFFTVTPPTQTYTLSLHDALPIFIYLQETLKASLQHIRRLRPHRPDALLTLDEVTRRSLELTRTLRDNQREGSAPGCAGRSEEHTSELQSHSDLVCRLLLEKKKSY